MIEEELPDELENDLDDIEPVGDESQLYEHFRVVVDKGQAMVRVDKYLFERIVNASRNRIQKAAEDGFVMANGKPVKSSYKVKPQDVLTVMMDRPRYENDIIPEDIPLDVVYEDEDLMVINKPADTDGQSLKVVAISDIHLGYATNKTMLAGYVDMINAQRPDIVLIGGDLIDNSVAPLRYEHMEEELSKIYAPLGVYMVPGNHEYISGIEESEKFIAQTPIVLLRDSVAILPNQIQLIGRDDRHNKGRKTLGQLTANLDKSKPVILLDHQPYDLEKTEEAGVDLQFSGHTHRGQVWPMNWIVDHLFELSYGIKKIGNSTIYVSSGLSLWGPPFRIGTDSEMVVFNITFKE